MACHEVSGDRRLGGLTVGPIGIRPGPGIFWLAMPSRRQGGARLARPRCCCACLVTVQAQASRGATERRVASATRKVLAQGQPFARCSVVRRPERLRWPGTEM